LRSVEDEIHSLGIEGHWEAGVEKDHAGGDNRSRDSCKTRLHVIATGHASFRASTDEISGRALRGHKRDRIRRLGRTSSRSRGYITSRRGSRTIPRTSIRLQSEIPEVPSAYVDSAKGSNKSRDIPKIIEIVADLCLPRRDDHSSRIGRIVGAPKTNFDPSGWECAFCHIVCVRRKIRKRGPTPTKHGTICLKRACSVCKIPRDLGNTAIKQSTARLAVRVRWTGITMGQICGTALCLIRPFVHNKESIVCSDYAVLEVRRRL